MQVEVRHLRSFVAVAEELNFTRAAERLHIAQQALSAQIRQLEERMGAQLFVRTSRMVELTPAGRILAEQAPALLRALEEVVETARQAADGTAGSLAVGLLATAELDLTPRLLREFHAERPNVDVTIHSVTFDEPSGGVATGETDVALVWLPFTMDGLAHEPLIEEPLLACLPADHPLAARDEVTATELAAEPFSTIDELDPVARDFWTLEAHRTEPMRGASQIRGFDEIFASVRAGIAVSVVPESIGSRLPFPDIAVRPVSGLEPATVALCWRLGDSNPLVSAFVECGKRLIQAV